MKFIGTLAALATAATAVTLGTEGEAAVEAQSGWDGPIVPGRFDHAVHDFNLEQPITD